MAGQGKAKGREAKRETRANAPDGAPTLPSLEIIQPCHLAYVRAQVARWRVFPAHVREDLVQVALIEGHKSRASPLEPRALLSGIVRNVVRRWFSRGKDRREALTTTAEEATDEPAVPTAEDDCQERQRREVVHAAIDTLPPMFREVFMAYEIDEIPMPEIAKALGLRPNTAASRLHLARARFAEAMRRLLAQRGLRSGDL